MIHDFFILHYSQRILPVRRRSTHQQLNIYVTGIAFVPNPLIEIQLEILLLFSPEALFL